MTRFAAAVHVVTTDGASGRRGVTVTSACSVSDDPATLLVCLNLSSPDNSWFEENGAFAVNVLSVDDQAVARAFAGEGGLSQTERFGRGRWSAGATGAPLLDTALASFDCRLIDAKVIATHKVLIGEVADLRSGRPAPSLVYLGRGFRSVDAAG
ncbi:flavin reductase [Jiella endophytica]|uniref:Flavin reductase n=1 Tax=Jiella endophytica TaxID=2558362 RepID=A0A4Y8RUG4_9HYPH|nr:flavin reductase family protein [Jiella endophytica]TFF27910.1 flavin reductase [Jiella endophytica]